jgi:hypothetical protein
LVSQNFDLARAPPAIFTSVAEGFKTDARGLRALKLVPGAIETAFERAL